jgi:hypothetical protein
MNVFGVFFTAKLPFLYKNMVCTVKYEEIFTKKAVENDNIILIIDSYSRKLSTF